MTVPGGPWLSTFTGGRFDLLAAEPEVKIEDVASGLAFTCRYAGQARQFYSVAEHCVLLSRWLAKETGRDDIALAALLHDAEEAFFPDIPLPYQALGEAWVSEASAFRARLRGRIFAGLGIEVEICDTVKAADRRILADELPALFLHDEFWQLDRPLGIKLNKWAPSMARCHFLKEFRRLR